MTILCVRCAKELKIVDDYYARNMNSTVEIFWVDKCDCDLEFEERLRTKQRWEWAEKHYIP
jgi:hypothetical protein